MTDTTITTTYPGLERMLTLAQHPHFRGVEWAEEPALLPEILTPEGWDQASADDQTALLALDTTGYPVVDGATYCAARWQYCDRIRRVEAAAS